MICLKIPYLTELLFNNIVITVSYKYATYTLFIMFCYFKSDTSSESWNPRFLKELGGQEWFPRYAR